MKKIAIPICNDFVSNVFDFAADILIVDIKDGKEISRCQVQLQSRLLPQLVAQLKSLEVDVIICGAVSRVLANMVIACGIEVLPYVTGRIDDVLQAYFTNQLVNPQFTMPGCWSGARNGFGRCGGRGQGRCRNRRSNF